MVLLVGMLLFQLVNGGDSHMANFDNEVAEGYIHNRGVASMLHYVYWLVGLVVSCYLVGYLISIFLFFIAFLLSKARISIARAGVLTLSAVIFMATLSHVMVLDLPQGLLQDVISMPWPLG